MTLPMAQPRITRTSINAARKQILGEVLSGMALDFVGAGDSASSGDSRLSSGRIVRLFVRKKRLFHNLQEVVREWQVFTPSTFK